MKTNLYLIPGFGDNCIGEGYSAVKKELKNKYNVIYSNVNWKNSTIFDWSEKFCQKYLKSKANKNIMVGFSYGSMLALNTAINLKPDKLILCSLSPFFSEFLEILPKNWIKTESKKRLNAFKNISLKKISSQIDLQKSGIYLLAGEKELTMWPSMGKALSEYKNFLNPKQVIIVPEAKHRLDNNYQQELIKLLQNL